MTPDFTPLFQLLRTLYVSVSHFHSRSKRSIMCSQPLWVFYLQPPSLSIHRKRKHAPVCATANEGNAALQLCYVVFACTSAVLTDVQTWHECTQSQARNTNRGKLEKRFVIGGSSFMCVLTLAKKLQVSTPWMYTKVRQLEFLLSFDQFKLPHTHIKALFTHWVGACCYWEHICWLFVAKKQRLNKHSSRQIYSNKARQKSAFNAGGMKQYLGARENTSAPI